MIWIDVLNLPLGTKVTLPYWPYNKYITIVNKDKLKIKNQDNMIIENSRQFMIDYLCEDRWLVYGRNDMKWQDILELPFKTKIRLPWWKKEYFIFLDRTNEGIITIFSSEEPFLNSTEILVSYILQDNWELFEEKNPIQNKLEIILEKAEEIYEFLQHGGALHNILSLQTTFISDLKYLFDDLRKSNVY
jgi:hypothetical protein